MLESTLGHHATFVLLSTPGAGLHTWYQCIPLPFLICLCFESWDCKREKLPVKPCVCARVRADGLVAQPLAGPAASQGTKLTAENMAKGGKENRLIPPALCNQLLCYFCEILSKLGLQRTL